MPNNMTDVKQMMTPNNMMVLHTGCDDCITLEEEIKKKTIRIVALQQSTPKLTFSPTGITLWLQMQVNYICCNLGKLSNIFPLVLMLQLQKLVW